ncbi:MAG: ABC transporter permease [Candidatus Eiseniibacteriota bacterium]|nr:MAG: ABC transporter permease [Candidatus Eisenbacteria bacterium]
MTGLDFLIRAFGDAFRLILSGDPEVYGAVSVSLQVAGTATVITTLLGIPLAFLIYGNRFRGRHLVITFLNTLMALPTVVVGLFVYAFITRRSILGPLDLLFSKKAMIIGEVVLALPIVIALAGSAVVSLDRSVKETARTLGAGPSRVLATILWEGRLAFATAVAAAFGRLIGEVGVSMILGGNIAGVTRNIPTAIATETSKGEFSLAMALGIVLMALALGVNFVLRYAQGRGESP